MEDVSADSDFLNFLLEAKKYTYAAQGDDSTSSTPLLPDAIQLEWCSGNWLYRDVYFGMTRFSGLETVYAKARAVWAMSYSGGMAHGADNNDIEPVYSFLRLALGQVAAQYPFRGPPHFSCEDLTYEMKFTGDTDRFEGNEAIRRGDTLLYVLNFSGGLIA